MPFELARAVIATRGSPLALAQTNLIIERCRQLCPRLVCEIKIIRTTGDKLQRASLAEPAASLPKGLFTKELESALLDHSADLAVHSLKDLPTDLPAGLVLGAVSEREDARDVLVYRTTEPQTPTADLKPPSPGFAWLPPGASVGTSSTRRKEQLLVQRPDLRIREIRGNVETRLQKVARGTEFHATLLAAAGLKRLGYRILEDGLIQGPSAANPFPGLRAALLDWDQMLPCVGQAAIGIETRADDPAIASVCRQLDHPTTHRCVEAERAFLRSMGGGCQSPVAAYASIKNGRLRLRGVSFRTGSARRAEVTGLLEAADALGRELAQLLGG